MDLVAHWLGAHSYETKYRPVPIEEHLVHQGQVYSTGSTSGLIKTATQLNQGAPSQSRPAPVRQIQPSDHKEFSDPVLNAVVALACETAVRGFGALVFGSSRAMCESDARWISRVMPGPHELAQSLVDKRMDLLSSLRGLGTGMDPVLEETVLQGVAFHRKFK